MADTQNAQKIAELRKKRTFKKFTFRGMDLDKLMDLSDKEFIDLLHSRARRRLGKGLKRKNKAFLNKLKKAKEAVGALDRPEPVKTHLRNQIVLPEMIGSVIGVYNGKVFNLVEVKPDMVGHYLGEFSITYMPVRHGRPAMGGFNNRFIP